MLLFLSLPLFLTSVPCFGICLRTAVCDPLGNVHLLCSAALNSPFRKPVSPYTTSKGVTFQLNLTAVDQETAEATCKEQGGHVAAYTTSAEQAEVEAFYIKKVGQTVHACLRQLCWEDSCR